MWYNWKCVLLFRFLRTAILLLWILLSALLEFSQSASWFSLSRPEIVPRDAEHLAVALRSISSQTFSTLFWLPWAGPSSLGSFGGTEKGTDQETARCKVISKCRRVKERCSVYPRTPSLNLCACMSNRCFIEKVIKGSKRMYMLSIKLPLAVQEWGFKTKHHLVM